LTEIDKDIAKLERVTFLKQFVTLSVNKVVIKFVQGIAVT